MSILMLDDNLREVEWNAQNYPRPKDKNRIEEGCLSESALTYDWKTKTTTAYEIVFDSMYLCGHPRIKLTGTAEDWDCILSNLDQLRAQFDACPNSSLGSWIAKTVLPIAINVRAALDGGNEDWFKEIFSEDRCGSGGQVTIDGWFSRLFIQQPKGIRYVSNFPTNVTKVPYTTLPSGTKWNMCFGLFHSQRDTEGFMVPDFSWVQVKKLTEPLVTPSRWI